MLRLLSFLSLTLLFLSQSLECHCQNDPVLAGMILTYSQKAQSSLKSENAAMASETTGHLWIKSEVDGTWKIQKEFNDYLDSFRGIIIYAAQIYGFYYEIRKLVNNMDGFASQLDRSPANAVAVALSPSRNTIYRELILSGIDIVNDIRQVCFDSSKMTEKQRIGIVFGIRPKLVKFNKTLLRLTKAVKYTSLNDIWLEIEGRNHQKADLKSITEDCFKRWRSNSRR